MGVNRPAFNPDPTSGAVPLWLPMGFIGFGLLSGFLLIAGLVAYLPAIGFLRLHPQLLSIVHLFTLGFGSAITVGALYQMAPVVLVTKLYSPVIGFVSFATFVPGSVLIVGSFPSFSIPGLATGATLTLIGTVLFVYNVGRTWTTSNDASLTRRFLLPAIISFLLAVSIGFLIAIMWQFGFRIGNRPVDLLGMHLFFGAIGWFTSIIIGVSYRLVGMFRLVHGHEENFGNVIMYILYVGVVAGAIGTFLSGNARLLIDVGLVCVTVAAVMYAKDFALLWKKGARPPDVWMKQVGFAIGYLVVSTLGTVILSLWTKFAHETTPVGPGLAVGTLFALGWIGTMIVALLHKIIPFLIWYHRYSPKVGKEPVPLMKDLVDETRGEIGFRIFHLSLIISSILMAIGAFNFAKITLIATLVAYTILSSDLVMLMIPDKYKSRVFSPSKQL